jgi:uncharacterized protein (DUF934 family)
MSQIINAGGFAAEDWDGETVAFDALWTGQDLPVDAALAVDLAVDGDPADLVPWFGRIGLVRVPFAKHADGRGFSLARRLRQSGYDGRLRAVGHLLPDQFRAALRAGFDEIEISDEQAARMPEAQWLAVPLGRGYQSRLFA